MAVISDLKAREILDSRGNPTVEVDIIVDNKVFGRAAVPSGASTGSKEAIELRDKNPKRYHGKGVLKAVQNIHEIIKPALLNKEITSQQEMDTLLLSLDSSNNKGNLGANAILAVSMACARAAAFSRQQQLYEYLAFDKATTLPIPLMNVINGGVHADNNLDFQEFMIVPLNAPSFKEALRMGVEVFHTLKGILHSHKLITNVGDEGGFAPNLKSHQHALDLITEAIHQAGFRPKEDIALALDVASSEFYQENNYHLKSEGKVLTAIEFGEYLENLVANYPIISIEDGMSEDDYLGWQNLTMALGDKIQLVGDDVFVTNAELLQQGINQKIANAILIKLNQIGTVTETLATIKLAKKFNYNTIISHRSGETGDVFIADLAVATSSGQIKTGSLCRTDRVAKYNQLLRIEEQLGTRARFLGSQVFKR